MANPRLPGISENEEALLYAKLNEYNRAPTGETKLFPLAVLSPARKAIHSLYT